MFCILSPSTASRLCCHAPVKRRHRLFLRRLRSCFWLARIRFRIFHAFFSMVCTWCECCDSECAQMPRDDNRRHKVRVWKNEGPHAVRFDVLLTVPSALVAEHSLLVRPWPHPVGQCAAGDRCL